jgi:hypothetical protein
MAVSLVGVVVTGAAFAQGSRPPALATRSA